MEYRPRTWNCASHSAQIPSNDGHGKNICEGFKFIQSSVILLFVFNQLGLKHLQSSLQVSLESEAPVDPMDAEQTWPTAEEIAEATKRSQPRKVKVIPKGMSEYQAAWIPDDDAGEFEFRLVTF